MTAYWGFADLSYTASGDAGKAAFTADIYRQMSGAFSTLVLIRNSGVEPTIIEYLKTPPTRGVLIALIARLGVPARAVI